jgi:hypothetical protein
MLSMDMVMERRAWLGLPWRSDDDGGWTLLLLRDTCEIPMLKC